jgi:hypothetical protein
MTEKKPAKLDDTELDKTVDGLVDAVMQSVEEGYDNPLMPFDRYVERAKLDAEKDVKEFRMRLRKGYIAILEALLNKKGIKKEDKEELLKKLASRHINTIQGDFRIYP